jgi:hypothetical protein
MTCYHDSGAASTAAEAAHVTVKLQLPRASSIFCCKVLFCEWLQVSVQKDDMVLERASGLRAIDVLRRIAGGQAGLGGGGGG